MTEAEICQTLYGDRSGAWLLIMSPTGLVLPPTMQAGTLYLDHIGDAGDVITGLLVRFAGPGRRPVQQAIAEYLGITQQSVSLYAAGGRPEHPVWPLLVLAYFDSSPIEAILTRIEAERAEARVERAAERETSERLQS